MLGGYAGKILRINLTERKIRFDDIDEQAMRKYIGGVGLAAKILWDETDGNVEPFSPENRLIFMTGPLTATMVPGTTRHVVVAVSPLTGLWGQAHAGGYWAYELKRAGFDGIVFQGKATKPVYLWVNNGQAELRDASHVWGTNTYETDEMLRRETDRNAVVATIGRAGEKLVRMAAVLSGGRQAKAAARCGLGAVMGDKNLKAVVVRGTQRLNVHDKENLRRSVSKHTPTALHDRKELEKYFTSTTVSTRPQLCFKNHLGGRLSPGFTDRWLQHRMSGGNYYCRGCRIGCHESQLTKEGIRLSTVEADENLGISCAIENVEALQEAFDLCQRYGMDTISVGKSIAFGMELFEKGLITKKGTGGIELKWGNHHAMLQMVKEIGEAEGFGRVLGEGVKKAAERIGGRALEYAMHSKGLELPLGDPRGYYFRALELATGNRPDNLSGTTFVLRFVAFPDLGIYQPPAGAENRFKTERAGEIVAKMQNLKCVEDSLLICSFQKYTVLSQEPKLEPSHMAEWLRYTTGVDAELQGMMRIGERIFNLKRMFNVRLGISSKDDTLPARILTHLIGLPGAVEALPPLEAMLYDYYSYRGWSEDGIPMKEKLGELEILDS